MLIRPACFIVCSSPHTRRYFHAPYSAIHGRALFSAHAEVFLSTAQTTCTYSPLLRTRGGISGFADVASQASSSSPHTRRYFYGGAG